jgi:hypothetical protein
MVKNFIVESHRRQPPPKQTSPDEDDDGLEAALERPSYIDMERHAVHASEEAEERKESKHPSRLVDVSKYATQYLSSPTDCP